MHILHILGLLCFYGRMKSFLQQRADILRWNVICNILAYRQKQSCKYGITFWENVCNSVKLFGPTGKFKRSKDSVSRVGKTIDSNVSVKKLSWTIRHIYVENINMHLQQKALIDQCSVNKGVLQKVVMHCTAMFLWWKAMKNVCRGPLFYSLCRFATCTSTK